jgi:hypothetical protein
MLLQGLAALAMKPRPRAAEHLLRCFPEQTAERVGMLLDKLLELGLVTRRGEDDVALVQDKLVFSESADGLSHRSFLRQAIERAAVEAEQRFHEQDAGLFTSRIVTVDEARYRAALPRIKQAVFDILATIEAPAGNGLVSFNVQIFPASRGSH